MSCASPAPRVRWCRRRRSTRQQLEALLAHLHERSLVHLLGHLLERLFCALLGWFEAVEDVACGGRQRRWNGAGLQASHGDLAAVGNLDQRPVGEQGCDVVARPSCSRLRSHRRCDGPRTPTTTRGVGCPCPPRRASSRSTRVPAM